MIQPTYIKLSDLEKKEALNMGVAGPDVIVRPVDVYVCLGKGRRYVLRVWIADDCF